MRLYILPMPLSRETPYWIYPYWKEVAQEVQSFFVERAARIRPFLERMGASPKACFYEYNPSLKDWDMHAYEAVFREKKEAALLSEGGLAGVGDPGSSLVRRAHAENYQVIPLAGPSSLTLALAASGLCGQKFIFWGYPPIEKRERKRFLQQIFSQAQTMTQIMMETPARSTALLKEIIEAAPHTLYLCVAHHLTSPQGFVRTQPISLWQPMTLPKAPTLFLLGK
ncbi:MAG: SAM-dependent methyltransferase [Bacteroidia bacterium]|nr:SAM-dependent methyltransferase [Bacteroidia bacterium]